MKNRKFWAGILAMTLIFGLTIIGCDIDKDDKIPNTKGRLTINSLADYNGKYVIAYPQEEGGPPYLVGAASLKDTKNGKGGKISNGAATIKIWSVDIATETLSVYSGNDQNVKILILILEKESVSRDKDTPIAMEAVTVSFTNGVGSVKYTAPGSLTITGLGDHNNKFVVANRDIENYSAPPYLVGADTLTSATSGTATRISNDSAILKIWEKDTDGNLTNYAGSAPNVELDIMIFDISAVGIGIAPSKTGKTTASFNNGVGNGTFVPNP